MERAFHRGLRGCEGLRIVGNMFRRILLFVLASSVFCTAADGDAAKEARFLKNTRQLIYEGKRSGEGYFSRDGKRLIFQSEREEGNPFYQIYLLDLETGDTERVSPGKGKTTWAKTGEVLYIRGLVNALISADIRTDIADGACYNDTFVEVAAARARRP